MGRARDDRRVPCLGGLLGSPQRAAETCRQPWRLHAVAGMVGLPQPAAARLRRLADDCSSGVLNAEQSRRCSVWGGSRRVRAQSMRHTILRAPSNMQGAVLVVDWCSSSPTSGTARVAERLRQRMCVHAKVRM